MRAVVFDRFRAVPVIKQVPEPVTGPDGVVVRVQTTGLCRSDAHGWAGHDDGITLPHVPGHELVGVIASVGARVRRFGVGDRVTVPFVSACGRCPECASGHGQVCRDQTQPGFTHWGSFAELVALHDAEVNLVAVPAGLDGGSAALLGCRFATAFRGLVQQAALTAGERLLVVGCGGVGQSAIMIGQALRAEVIAVDVDDGALAAASGLGATHTVNSAGLDEAGILARIRAVAPDGVPVAVDALGSPAAVRLGIRALAIHGRHVQIGLLTEDPAIPMSEVIAKELVVRGSHGLAAADYPALLAMVGSGAVRPHELIQRRITLDEAPAALVEMGSGGLTRGITVIDVEEPGSC